MPDASQSLVGTVLDRRYRVDALIGSGAMGAVYRATHVLIDRPVAIKLLGHFAPDARQRFLKEARVVSRIEHPNVVQLSDCGETEDGGAYFVMELLAGEPLSARIARERQVPPLQTYAIVEQIVAGLAAAHAVGIVHRDLKPENVFLCEPEQDPGASSAETEAPRVKLLDFGVARVTGSRDTRPGAVLGTPEYMAPEQAQGQTVDSRADLYALGVMLFEMLVGRVPLYASDVVELIRRKLTETAPRVREVAPQLGIEPEIDELVAALLAAEPGARPVDAGAVAKILRGSIEERQRKRHEREQDAQRGRATIGMGSASSDALAVGQPAQRWSPQSPEAWRVPVVDPAARGGTSPSLGRAAPTDTRAATPTQPKRRKRAIPTHAVSIALATVAAAICAAVVTFSVTRGAPDAQNRPQPTAQPANPPVHHAPGQAVRQRLPSGTPGATAEAADTVDRVSPLARTQGDGDITPPPPSTSAPDSSVSPVPSPPAAQPPKPTSPRRSAPAAGSHASPSGSSPPVSSTDPQTGPIPSSRGGPNAVVPPPTAAPPPPNARSAPAQPAKGSQLDLKDPFSAN